MERALDRVVDLLDPSLNQIHNMTTDEARRHLLSAAPEAVRGIDGSFALFARDGVAVRIRSVTRARAQARWRRRISAQSRCFMNRANCGILSSGSGADPPAGNPSRRQRRL
jgi:hypothetical protein